MTSYIVSHVPVKDVYYQINTFSTQNDNGETYYFWKYEGESGVYPMLPEEFACFEAIFCPKKNWTCIGYVKK